MVAGACALLLQMNPASSPAAIKTTLLNNAEDKGPAGWDVEWGSGLIDLGPIVAPPSCDLAVDAISYTPSPVDCNQPVTVKVTVKNVGTTVATNFQVRIQYWYFGPNNAPPVRYDLTTAPIQNTSGALGVGATRDLSGTFNLKLLTTPLSQHTCFWGIVDAFCDNNSANNERNANATIQNLNGTQCKQLLGPSQAGSLGDTMEVPIRLAHHLPFNIPVTVAANKPDTANWYFSMNYGLVHGDSLILDVDPSGCPAEVKIRVLARHPGTTDSVKVHLRAYNPVYGDLGTADVYFLARRPCSDCGDANGDAAVDISDAVYLIQYIFAGGAAPGPCGYALGKGDANGDCAVDISDAVYLIQYIFAGGAAPHCGTGCK